MKQKIYWIKCNQCNDPQKGYGFRVEPDWDKCPDRKCQYYKTRIKK